MAKKKIHKHAPTDEIRAAAVDMSKREVQFLIETFLKWQSLFIATKAKAKFLEEQSLNNINIQFTFREIFAMRRHISEFADLWTENHPAAKYFKDTIVGVGPIIAAGLAAYIDIDKCKNHYSSLWCFAGQTPTSRPLLQKEASALIEEAFNKYKNKYGDKAQEDHVKYLVAKLGYSYDNFLKNSRYKDGPIEWNRIFGSITRPRYCVPLKLICNTLGNSIINKKSVYQALFRHRCSYEHKINESGGYAKRARKQLARFEFNKKKTAYKMYSQGKLPRAHIIARAKRYAVKILLAHYYMIEYYIRYGEAPPDVYALDVLKGHRKIHVPGNWKEFCAEIREKEISNA